MIIFLININVYNSDIYLNLDRLISYLKKS